MFLETERLILRKFREEDFADYYGYAADREMCRMMGNYDLTDREAAQSCFDWLKDKEERSYAIVRKEDGRVIGNLNVCAVPKELSGRPELAGRRGASLSFCLSRDYRRRGLMEEAVRAVIDELFRVEGMDYVQCGYFDFNLPSEKFQEKLGFKRLTTSVIDFDWSEEEFHSVENVLWRTDWHGTHSE